MEWIADHQVLLAVALLVLLVIAGIVVMVVRAIALFRVAKDAQARVDRPVRAISDGLASAERRVGELQTRQGDLTETIESVGARAGELGQLLAVAGKAVAVLRAPLKYLGK